MTRPTPAENQSQSLHTVLLLTVASLLLALPVRGALPGFEMRHIGPMEKPELRFSYALAEDPDQTKALLFGGSTPAGTWSSAIREYEPATNTWRTLPLRLPYDYVANERHGAARASNGRYYVGPGNGPGGWGQNDQIIEVDFDQGTVSERAPVVSPGANIWGIALAPAPASKGGIYLFGGWNGGGIGTIRHYDPVTDQMTVKGTLSVPRTVGVRVTHPNGRIYLFGGNTSSSATFRAAEVFDPADESLRVIANPQQFGFNHGTQGWVGSNGMIYLWNPDAPYLGSASASLVRFDPVSEQFTDLGAQPLSGHHALSSFHDFASGEVYFFGLVLPGSVWGVSADTVGQVWRLSQGPPPVLEDYRVAFNRGFYPTSRPWIAGLDGGGVAELAAIDVASFVKIAAGKAVFMAEDYQGQGPGIYTMEAVPGAPVSKIPNTENVLNAHSTNFDALDISPDGLRVIWAGPEPGDVFQNHNVYVIDLDGSNKIRILRNTSKHHFMITWGEDDRVALMVSDVGNAFSQRPHTVRPDGSQLIQAVADFAQSPHVGGAEGRMVMTVEQPAPRLATTNNAIEQRGEVPGPLFGYTLTAWHPSRNTILGSSGGDLYEVDIFSGQQTLLFAGGTDPCLGGDVGLGGDAGASSGLIVDARLDEGFGVVTDAGSGLTGTVSGGASWTTGQQSSAIEFDGTGYIEILDDGSQSPLDVTESLTLAAWIRPDRLGGTQVLISKDNAYELEIGKWGDGVWDLRLNNEVVGIGDSPIVEGVWQHLAVTWDGSTVRFYFNGQADGSALFSDPLATNNDNLGIGARPALQMNGGSVFHLVGAIDHAQVYDRALSSTEIADLFTSTLTDISPPVRFDAMPDRVVTTTPVPISLATDESATCRYGEIAGSRYADLPEIFALTGDTYHSSDFSPLEPITLLKVRCRDSLGNVNAEDLEIGIGIGSSDIALGLAADWPFDEATGCDALDLTGNGHDALLGLDCATGNAPSWSPGLVGAGLLFDGLDDAVVATPSVQTQTPAAVTLSAWIQLPTSHVWQAIVDVRDSGTDGYNLFVTDDSRAFMRVNSASAMGSGTVADGQWHFVAGVFDGALIRLYVDGVLDTEATINPTTIDVTAPISLGTHFAGGFNYDGLLDSVKLHDRALTDVEVLDLYLATSP